MSDDTISQIKDRMVRVASAQDDLALILESVENLGRDSEKEIAANLRTKYEIPEGVHLFSEGLTKAAAKDCKRHIAAFVRGELTEDGMSDLIFYFDELAECDYGWILIERPMGFYSQPTTFDPDKVRDEIVSIGTRSRSKNTKLPRITRGRDQ